MYRKGSRPGRRTINVHTLLLSALAMIASVVLDAVLRLFSSGSLVRLGAFAPASGVFLTPASAAIKIHRAAPFMAIASLSCALLLLNARPAPAQPPEMQLKAVMLYHFTLFIDWPDRAFPNAASPFIICSLGEDSLQSWLRDKLGNLTIGVHSVDIRQLEHVEQAADCHLLYIGRSEQPRLQQILARLRNTSVLTVSDIDDFCNQGGMIELLTEDHQMRFDLNAEATEAAGLKIDSALKRIARNIDCGEQE
jgi:hypothetical protein